MLSAWLLAYRIVLGTMWGTSDREAGSVALPTHEVCEAVREALLELPPVAHGALAIEPCRESLTSGPESTLPPGAPTRTAR